MVHSCSNCARERERKREWKALTSSVASRSINSLSRTLAQSRRRKRIQLYSRSLSLPSAFAAVRRPLIHKLQQWPKTGRGKGGGEKMVDEINGFFHNRSSACIILVAATSQLIAASTHCSLLSSSEGRMTSILFNVDYLEKW